MSFRRDYRPWRRMALCAGIALSLLAILSACAGLPATKEASTTPAKQHSNLRPVGSPDIVIIDFSGRCGVVPFTPDCIPPEDNTTYLANYKNRTVQEVRDAFTTLGYSVQTFNASAFIDSHYSRRSQSVVPGYAEAERYLESVYRKWIKGYANPTRVVILAHSHGVIWASLLIWNHPKIRFAYAIYLDGICALWRGDNMVTHHFVQDYFAKVGRPLPWPLASANPEAPCDIHFTRIGVRNISDVIPWNVGYGLEVISDGYLAPGIGLISDTERNVRPDDSTTNLSGIYSLTQFHTNVPKAGTPDMNWVYTEILKLRLPPVHPTSSPPAEPPSSYTSTPRNGNQASGIISKPRLGVSVTAVSRFPAAVRKQLSMPTYGVVVMSVAPGGPAQKAGLMGPAYQANISGQDYPAGEDIIVTADGIRLTSTGELQNIVLSKSAGEYVRLLVWRNGRTRMVTVRLEVVP